MQLTDIEKMFYTKFLKAKKRQRRLIVILGILVSLTLLGMPGLYWVLGVTCFLIIILVIRVPQKSIKQELEDARKVTIKGMFQDHEKSGRNGLLSRSNFYVITEEQRLIFLAGHHTPMITLGRIVKDIKNGDLVEVDTVLGMHNYIFDLRQLHLSSWRA